MAMTSLLAASDWQSLAAIIVFTLISLIANWVKKRSEAAAGPNASKDSDSNDEFEPVELFDEPKPMRKPPPMARPPAPLIAVLSRGRPQPAPTKKRKATPLTAEPQIRIGNTRQRLSTLHVTENVTRQTPAKTASGLISADRGPAEKTPATAQRTAAIPDFFDARTLRRAIVAAEILNPPIALRDPSQTFGHVH